MDYVGKGIAAQQALGEIFDHAAVVNNLADGDALGSAAVHLADDDLLRNVHQAAGQIAGVGGAQRGIGKALAGAAEELKYSRMLRPSR